MSIKIIDLIALKGAKRIELYLYSYIILSWLISSFILPFLKKGDFLTFFLVIFIYPTALLGRILTSFYEFEPGIFHNTIAVLIGILFLRSVFYLYRIVFAK